METVEEGETTPTKEVFMQAIMLAFHHPKGDPLRHDGKGFKRKTMEQITDKPDPRLEPARLAPSAVNSQPWYFTHDGDTIRVYCSKKGSRLDIGMPWHTCMWRMQKPSASSKQTISPTCRDMAISAV